MKLLLENNGIKTDIKNLIQEYNAGNNKVQEVLHEVVNMMQPLYGMSTADTINEGVEIRNWSQKEALERLYELQMPNMVIQKKSEAGLIPKRVNGAIIDGSGASLRELLKILTD